MARKPTSLSLRLVRHALAVPLLSRPWLRRRLLRCLPLILSVSAAAQIGIAPLPGDGGIFLPPGGSGPTPGDGGGPVVIIPGDGGFPTIPVNPGDGGIIVLPPDFEGGGLPGGLDQPTILVARGAVAGDTVSASAFAPGVSAAAASYQWTITGGRALTSARSPQLEFVADRPGTVSLSVVITAGGSSYNASADVTIVSAATAGTITVPATAVRGGAPLTASVPPASGGDRTFRWTISGDATISGARDAASVTFSPGSPGLRELTCFVNLQNLVSVPVRATVVVHGDGAPVAVTVSGGSGGGTYNGGSLVHLFAHAPAAGEVFDRWTGDTATLGDAAAALQPHVVLTVPVRPVSLTATYKNSPAWTPTVTSNFGGAEASLRHHIPAGARALVFLLHETGAEAAGWFNRPEHLTLARDLAAAGFGVAALDSAARGTAAAWSNGATLATNADARNHASALEKFARENLLPAGQPVFFLGVGAGGNAAALVSHLLASAPGGDRVKGVALFHAAGTELLAATSRVPHLYALAGSTENATLLVNTEARGNAQLLAGRGVAAESFTSARSPLPAERLRILAATASAFATADAQTLWSALKTADVLDPNNYVRESLTAAEVSPLLPAALRLRAADVAAQLKLANAEPELASEAAPRVRAFFEAQLAGARAPAPGRIANLSTRTRIAFLGDSFHLGFTLTGTEPVTLLIRGVGPGLARFGLDTALAAPRLELRRGASLVAANDGWETGGETARLNAAAASVGAFPLVAGDVDTALLLTLEPGAYVTALQGRDGTTGDVLVEVYDVSRNATRLTNLSTLGQIHHDGDVLVPGLVVSGPNPRTVIARAIGPGLADVGYARDAVLGDPRLSVQNGAGATIDANQNWSTGNGATLSSLFALVGAFPLKANSPDAAVLTPLPPGGYTLQVGATAFLPLPGGQSEAPNPTGTVLVEIYEVP